MIYLKMKYYLTLLGIKFIKNKILQYMQDYDWMILYCDFYVLVLIVLCIF